MTILLTGATGFIGRAVLNHALASGERVIAYARSASALPDHPALQVVTISDLSDIPAFPGGRLIHLAWEDVGKYTAPKNLTDNLAPQFTFLKRMVDNGVNDITIAGTCLEYGMLSGALREDLSCAPATYYGLAKLTLLRMLELYRTQQKDFCMKWLRYFYVYGEGQRPQSLFGQLEQALARRDATFPMSPADQLRDFIHIDTLAHNTLAAARQTDIHGVINIGNGRGVTVLEQANRLVSAHGGSIRLEPGHYPYPAYEPFAFWADISRLAEIPHAKFDA